MSYQLAAAALRVQGISSSQKLVLIALADHANKSGVCWPSISEMAELVAMARSTVIRAVSELKKIGLIDVKKGAGKSTVYTLQLVAPCDRLPVAPRYQSTGDTGSTTLPTGSAMLPDQSHHATSTGSTTLPTGSTTLPEPIKNQSENQSENQSRTNQSKAKPANVEEVIVYCLERGLTKLDGEAFFDGREATNWRTKTGPIKDWKAALRNYQAHGWHPSQKTNGHHRQTPDLTAPSKFGF